MAQKFLTEITLQALNNATTDTDKFLVSDSGTIKFRTGTQVLSDIGGQAALTNPITGTGTLNYVSKFTGTTSLGNSQIFDNGTNVGIGTTSPSAGLQINRSSWGLGGSNVSRMLQKSVGFAGDYEQHVILLHPIYNGTLIDYNKCSGTIYASRGGTGMGLINDTYYIDTASAYNTYNGTINSTIGNGKLYTCNYNGVKYMALLPDYRTSAVEYDFDGYIKSTGEELKVIVYRLSNSGTIVNSEVYNSLVEYSPSNTVYFGGGLQIVGQLLDSSGDGGVWGQILSSTSTGTNWVNAPTGTISGSGTTNYVPKFTGSTSVGNSLIYDNGTSVGINTTTETDYNLNVVNSLGIGTSTTQYNGIFLVGNGSNNISFFFEDTQYGEIKFGEEGNNIYAYQAPLNIYTGTNLNINLMPGGTGNVGIGTTNPSAKLNVSGNLHLGAYSNLSTVNIENRTGKSVFSISTDGVNNAVGTTITYSWADGGHGPLKFNNASGEVMRLDASGKLGVGTTTPTSRVHSVTSASGPVSFDNRCAVYGHNTSTDTIYNNPVGIAGRVLTSGGIAVYGDASTGSGWAGYFSGKGYFSANVGIGTTTPSYPLDVNGVAILRNALYMTSGGTSSVPAWSFSINGSGDLVVDEGVTTQNFIFSNAGQVLIGTTVGGTPTYGSVPQFVTAAAGGGVIDIRSLNTNIVADSLLGRIQFTGKDDLTVGYTSAAIEAVSAGSPSIGSNGGGTLKFMTSITGYSTNPLPRMWISYLGYVTIGSTNSNSYPLRVLTQVSNISIYADYDIVAFSDQSVKENIRPIENVIERVQKSRGVLYDRIDSGNKDNIGFIAQELEVAFPELVTTNEDGTKAVKYQNAVAVMFEAIKEQQKQIDELKELVNKLIK